jgi:hypothetical protein
MDTEDWLMDTERKLKAVGANDEEKVRYVVHLLSGPAAAWWDNEVTLQHPEKVFSWEEFKEKFRTFHVPESVVELKRREFEDLKQGSATMMAYIKEFMRLSRYVSDEVSTDSKRMKRFLRGLDPYAAMQMKLTKGLFGLDSRANFCVCNAESQPNGFLTVSKSANAADSRSANPTAARDQLPSR